MSRLVSSSFSDLYSNMIKVTQKHMIKTSFECMRCSINVLRLTIPIQFTAIWTDFLNLNNLPRFRLFDVLVLEVSFPKIHDSIETVKHGSP